MTRGEAWQVWQDAKYVYLQSRLNDVRRKAKAIALTAEKYITDLPQESAQYWKE